MLGLTVERNGTRVRRTLSEGESLVLGCGPECDLEVGGAEVLPAHVRVEAGAGGLRLVALDASRPVLVNDVLTLDGRLDVGDRIRIGETQLEIHASGDDSGPAPRSRLTALDGFAATDTPPEPDRPRRLVIDTTGEPGLDELPDVAHEVRTLRRILEINKRLARQRDADGLIAAFLDGAIALTGASRSYLVGRDGAGGVRVLHSRDAGGDLVPDAAREVCGELARRALESRASVIVADFQRDALRLGADPRDAAGARSILCVPYPADEPRALYLDSRREEGLFSHLDADLLRAFAEQAGLCAERVRLLVDNSRQKEQLLEATQEAEELNARLAALLERRTVELREAREDLALVDDAFRQRFTEIVGRGPAMLHLLRQVDRVADTDVPVLFEGESGTGKELLARALHAGSGRASARFVAENCAALPDTLLENELFGHERGAFTGADAPAMGLFERADGGTLFLDEVGDMSVNLQKRLLRVLQEGEVRRVGGSAVRKVDVRIVTATNRDLLEMVRAGSFREDLYYRLAVVKVRVPPLRERREDVPDLVAHFLNRTGEGAGFRLPAEVMERLVHYDWPGNVRQLENEIRRIVALSRDGATLEALSAEVREGRPPARAAALDAPDEPAAGQELKALVEALEIRVVRATLEREGGNITRSARALGLSRLGLRKKMQRYGLVKPAREGR